MGKRWDAREVAAFIDELGNEISDYGQKASYLEDEFGSYNNNNEYRGIAAEASKEFVSIHQIGNLHKPNRELQKEFYKRCCDVEDAFKNKVDTSPEARIDTDVVRKIDRYFDGSRAGISAKGRMVESLTEEVSSKFSEYGNFIPVKFGGVRTAYDDLCGDDGHLEETIKRFEKFDMEAHADLKSSGLRDEFMTLRDRIIRTAAALNASKIFDPRVEKTLLKTITFGANAVKGEVDNRSLEETKINKWLDENYHMSDAEIKEARELCKIKLAEFEYDSSYLPILNTEEEKLLYRKYVDLQNKTYKGISYSAGIVKIFYGLTDFAFDSMEWLVKNSILPGVSGKEINWDSDPNNLLNRIRLAYMQSREEYDSVINTTYNNALIQNPNETKAGEFTGKAILYFSTSDLFEKAAGLFKLGGKVSPFIIKQIGENLQDLAIDTRNLYSDMMKDGKLTGTEMFELGDNILTNAVYNLGYGMIGETVDLSKLIKNVELENIVKNADDVGELAVKKVDDVAEVAAETSDDMAKAASGAEKEAVSTAGKPQQVHHYATNKSKTYTPQFEEITKKYNLDLDSKWNKDLFPHQGRHPNLYHDYVLESMKQFDEIAQGNKDIFLQLYESLKTNIKNNPEMLYKDYWITGG